MISVTLDKHWTGPYGLTYPPGTVFYVSRLEEKGIVWAFISPCGAEGHTLYKNTIFPGAKEIIDVSATTL